VADVNCDHGCTGAEHGLSGRELDYNSLELVPLASREGFGGFFGAIAVHLFMTKPARRNVVPIKEDARTPVRETDFEAARLGHDLVLDNSNWHPRGLSPGRSLDELMQRIRQFATLFGAVLAQLSRYVLGHVANPTFGDIKANDANRVPVLAFQQIADDSFKIGVFNVCLAPSTTQAEVVEDQIGIPVDAGDDRS
jgi:hypothetical protein